MKPTLIIMAAGMGSRYGSLKQVDKLGPNGETIIDYSVFDAMEAGFGKVVFVIRRSIEKDFMEVFDDRFLARIPYEIVFQELDMLPDGFTCPEERTKPWGTAHAVWVCRNVVKEPFVVINADDFYGKQAYQTLARFLGQCPEHDANHYAMCGYRIRNTLSEHGTVTRGICKTDPDGYLESVDEHLNIEPDGNGHIISHLDTGTQVLDPDAIVSMNIWAFNPTVFDIIETEFREFLKNHIHDLKSEIYTPEMVDTFIQKNIARVKVIHSQARWFGVTYAEDKHLVMQKLKELTERKEYPGEMW